MTTARIVNEEALATVVTGFLQDDLNIEGYEVKQMDREANKLIVCFRKEIKHKSVNSGAMMRLGNVNVVAFKFDPEIWAWPDDSIQLAYTLTWDWEGGGGGVTPAGSPPACGLVFTFDFATAA